MTFKLKDEYVGWLDPFYYLNPELQSAIYQQYEQKYKGNEKVNDILGDLNGCYKYHTFFKTHIGFSLATHSDFVKIVTTLLNIWIDKLIECQIDSKNKNEASNGEIDVQFVRSLIDQNLANHLLKLLALMLESAAEKRVNSNDLIKSQILEFAISLSGLMGKLEKLEPEEAKMTRVIEFLDDLYGKVNGLQGSNKVRSTQAKTDK